MTDKYAPEIYGAGLLRQPGNAQYMFQERFRTEGGKFFDEETMKATVNSDVGVKVFNEMLRGEQVDAARRGAVGLHRGVQRLSGR